MHCGELDMTCKLFHVSDKPRPQQKDLISTPAFRSVLAIVKVADRKNSWRK